MELILAIAGLGIVVWALYTLFFPPRKHKDFALHDRDQATSRALGGGGTPDLTKLEPQARKRKKKHKS